MRITSSCYYVYTRKREDNNNKKKEVKILKRGGEGEYNEVLYTERHTITTAPLLYLLLL